MIKKSSFLLLSLVTLLFSDNSASYNGNTGILETPNARILPDWSMRFFLNQDSPYTYYGITATPLPFLEGNFHVTQLSGVSGFADDDGYGDYKDKSISGKILLRRESRYLPSVVFGADDVWGTALYTSKYFAFSKKISYFDFTLGYAKGRLGGEDLRKYDSNSGNSGSLDNNAVNFLKSTDWGGGLPFGSVVAQVTPSLTLMTEYSPIDYSKDKVNPFTSGDEYELPRSKFNFGAKYRVSDHTILTASYQRGNQLSFGYTFQFGFSKTAMFNHLPDPKWKADAKKLKEYEDLSEKELSNKLSNEVAAESFSNVQTAVHENKIWAEIDNPRYNSDLQAIGRAVSTIDEVAPENYDTIYMTLKKKDIPVKTFKFSRKEFDAYENERVSDQYMRESIKIDNDVDSMYKEFSQDKEIYKTDIFGTQKFNYYIGPDFKTYLNAPSKPFAMKINVQAMFNYDFDTGLFLKGKITHPLYNDIKDISDNEPLEDNDLSIRSNSIDYYKYDDTQLKRLTLDYVLRLPYSNFTKAEIGYVDYAYAGLDLEWYRTFFDDRLGLGLQYQHMYKRPVDDMFDIYDGHTYDAKFLNIYYLLSQKYDTHVGFKIGEFLAGDRGVRAEVTRHYKEFTIGAFATVTDSNEVFTSSQNRGYIDKGIFIKIPLDVFTYKNMKGRVNYGLSPWTRDAGQYADTSYSLFPMNSSENNNKIMKKNIHKLKD